MSTAPPLALPTPPVLVDAAVLLAPAVRVDAATWAHLVPIVPEVRRRRHQPGRRRRDDRAVLEGILHVLATGIGWRDLPQELGCGSGVTCWRRLREWVDAGVWDDIEARLRPRVDPQGRIDWARAHAGRGTDERLPRRLRAVSAMPARGPDPGATTAAVRRRCEWYGPSLI